MRCLHAAGTSGGSHEDAVSIRNGILKDLANLWADLGKQEEAGGLRACTMTLIVVSTESRTRRRWAKPLAALMHEHPSRAIYAGEGRRASRVLEARVFAQCWMPFGRRQQICCEQIEITASKPPRFRHGGSGMVVPDLPVMIYCGRRKLAGAPSSRRSCRSRAS